MIDTDVGTDVDDLWTLAMVPGLPDVHLEAVTVVYGDTDLRARLASVALNAMGIDAPIHRGCEQTLSGKSIMWAGHEGDGVDGIDVAVFLGLHFDGNRPTLPALRCAPIQISSCDVSSMAMEEIDYLVSDRTMSPVRGGERLQERVLALPHFYVHAPLDTGAGSIATERPGGMTVSFGAFNLPSKMNDTVLALWARVLAAVPGSRLSFRYFDHFAREDGRAPRSEEHTSELQSRLHLVCRLLL